MDRKSKESAALQQILEEMFSRVGDTYSPEKTLKEDWYRAHEWTLMEEHEFIHWLTAFLKRKRLCYTATSAKRAAEMFVFQHGWRLSDLLDVRELVKHETVEEVEGKTVEDREARKEDRET